MAPDWSPLWLSLRYAGLATLLALGPGVALAQVLGRPRFRGREALEAAANLPLVLPPAVLVYYLLAAMGRWPIVFHWRAAVALSAIYTLPLVMHMAHTGLAAVDPSFAQAARSLGAPEWRIFWRISAPLAWRALVAAALAGFARALVDFGATAMVASGSRGGAALVLLLVAAAFAALYAGSRLQRGQVWA